MIQTSMLWMNVYSGLVIEDDELWHKRFLPLRVMEKTLPMQLMASTWFISFYTCQADLNVKPAD
jgi:hypothetical protein